MIHQPLGGARGQCSDIQIQAKEISDLRTQLQNIYVKHSGKMDYDTVTKETDRDNYMTPDEAIKLGLIDAVISKTSNTK